MSRCVSESYRKQSIERIEAVFSRVCPELDSRRLTRELLHNFGTLEKLFATPYDVVAGMWGKRVAMFLRVAAALYSRRGTESFEFEGAKSKSEICEYFKAVLIDECVEVVLAMPVDDSGAPICQREITRGVVNASDITARSVAEAAYSVGSKRVIIAHNHPRGTAKPSDADLHLTRSLGQALANAGITLEYHVVVSGQECEIIDLNQEPDEEE